jgi:hypothetical protein
MTIFINHKTRPASQTYHFITGVFSSVLKSEYAVINKGGEPAMVPWENFKKLSPL